MTHPNYRRFGIYCRKNSDQWVRTRQAVIVCITNGMCSFRDWYYDSGCCEPDIVRALTVMSALRSLATQIGPLVANSLLFPRSDNTINESC